MRLWRINVHQSDSSHWTLALSSSHHLLIFIIRHVWQAPTQLEDGSHAENRLPLLLLSLLISTLIVCFCVNKTAHDDTKQAFDFQHVSNFGNVLLQPLKTRTEKNRMKPTFICRSCSSALSCSVFQPNPATDGEEHEVMRSRVLFTNTRSSSADTSLEQTWILHRTNTTKAP